MRLKENVDITNALNKMLDEHSVEFWQNVTPDKGKEYFSFALENDDGVLIGGLTAKLKFGQFHIQLLAVSKEFRNQGFGKKLMLVAEEKARELNCHHLFLTTYSYQGTEFYPKMGFVELARISNFPAERVDKVYFIKYLISVK